MRQGIVRRKRRHALDADAEEAIFSRWGVFRIHAGNQGKARPLPQQSFEFLKGGWRAGGDHFHGAVAKILCVAAKPDPLGVLLDEETVADALHAAADHKAFRVIRNFGLHGDSTCILAESGHARKKALVFHA